VQDADPIAVPVGEQADDDVRWGLGDAAVGWLLAQVGAVIAISIVVAVTGDEPDDLPIAAMAMAQTGLWLGMFGVPYFATRFKGHGLVRDLGLRFQPTDILYLGVGVVCQFAFTLVYLPLFWLTDIDQDDLSEPARELTDRAQGGLGVVILLLVVGVGAPIFEEIFYRGLTQRSMIRRLGPWPGVIVTAVIFGAAHFQPLQFPSLALFGLVLGYLAYRHDRLGPSIAAHMGFNLISAIVLVTS
jgi:membrane protease YdiL (CAAX protease family)